MKDNKKIELIKTLLKNALVLLLFFDLILYILAARSADYSTLSISEFNFFNIIKFFPVVVLLALIIHFGLRNEKVRKMLIILLIELFNILLYAGIKVETWRADKEFSNRLHCANAICGSCNRDYCDCQYQDDDDSLKSVRCPNKNEE